MIYVSIDVEIKRTPTAVASIYASLIEAGLSVTEGQTDEDLRSIAEQNQRELERYCPDAATYYCCGAQDVFFWSKELGTVVASFVFQNSASTYRCDVYTDEEQFDIWEQSDNGHICRVDIAKVDALEQIAKILWQNEDVLLIQSAWEGADCSPLLQEIKDGTRPNVQPFCILPKELYRGEYGRLQEHVCRNAWLVEDSTQLVRCENGTEQKEYIYCGVQFTAHGQTYSYRTEDESIAVGDEVFVPVSVGNGVHRVTVVTVTHCTEKTVPYPLALTKRILGKTSEYGIREDELLYQYVMAERTTKKDFVAVCKLIEEHESTGGFLQRDEDEVDAPMFARYETADGVIRVDANVLWEEGVFVYTPQPRAYLEEKCRSWRPPKKRLRAVKVGVWAEIEHAYDQACRAFGCNGYELSKEGRLAGWNHLLRAYHAAEQARDKDDVIYARILYLMLQVCTEGQLDRLHTFAIPMMQAYDRALADERSLCEQEYDRAKKAYERIVYYEECMSNSGEAAWKSELLIDGNERLDEFGGIWDSQVTGFEYTGERAILRFEKGNLLMVMRFDGVISVNVCSSDACEFVKEMSCYRHFDEPERLIFDIGAYRIECATVTVESVRRSWGRR